jgi:hypothetical protein
MTILKACQEFRQAFFFKELVQKLNLWYCIIVFKNSGSRPKGAVLADGQSQPTSENKFGDRGEAAITTRCGRVITGATPVGLP